MTISNSPTSSDTGAPESPLAVLFLANPFVFDTRVDKQARSLLSWGFRVVLLCKAAPGLPAKEVRDGLEIERYGLRRADFLRALALSALGPSAWLARMVLNQSTVPPLSLPEADPGAPSEPLNVPRQPSPWLRGMARFLPPSAPRLAYCLSFARRAAELKPTLAVAHDLDTVLAGVVLKRARQVPLLFDSHELFVERNVGHSSRNKERRFWGRLERRWIHDADAVTTVAEGIAQHLAAQYGIRKPTLVRNVQRFEEPAPKTLDLHEKVGAPDDTRLVIYAGALTLHRGLEQLVEASRHLPDGKAFVIMGYAHDPSYRSRLEEAASEAGTLDRTIYFTDAVDISEVTHFVAGAALGIVPTQAICKSYEFEASNKIFHCVMAGVPLAMSDHVEKRLLVEEWDIGVLFDETRPEEIARSVTETLDDKGRLEQLAAKCLVAAKHLNWEGEEERLRELVQSLTSPAVRATSAPTGTS